MPSYYRKIINPLFRDVNAVNWALFFFINATNCKHPAVSVNDFVDLMGWTEDDYPSDTLLRQYNRVITTYYKNIRTAFDCDAINEELRNGWIRHTYKYWKMSFERYKLEGSPIEQYLDFIQVKPDMRKTLKVIALSPVIKETSML